MESNLNKVLLVSCPDRPGIIAAVTTFLAARGINILESDQHTDPDERAFFMRLEIDTADSSLNQANFDAEIVPVLEPFGAIHRVDWRTKQTRIAILATKEGHCLSDLLYRCQSGEIGADVPLVISNHDELRHRVEPLGIPFHHVPLSAGSKAEQEAAIGSLFAEREIDLIVLARYMQVLSPEFVSWRTGTIINIHHSFLPAFAGSRPYHQAHQRGVKIIGATAHYVTAELDAGPIIAQQTTPVDHRDNIDDLVRKGRDLERVVLAQAVRAHVEDRVLIAGNKTIVFD